MKYKYNGQWYDIYSSPLLNNLLIGEILTYAGNNIPGGYLICDGAAISRTEYSELFDVIGEIYGSGDGSTTFNLPDLKGRVITGLNSSDTSFNTLGLKGGEAKHTLTVNEMPSHNHGLVEPFYKFAELSMGLIGQVYKGEKRQDHTWYSEKTGGGQAHNNMPPYITINYLIRAKKTKNVLTTVSTVIDSLDGNSTTDAPSINAVNKRFTYSTEEVVIGRWIDGKPLYRKTIQASVVAGINSLASTVSNIDYLWIDLSKSFIKGTMRTNPLARADYMGETYSIGTVYGSDTNIIYVKLGTDSSLPGTAYITMNYTKTTD